MLSATISASQKSFIQRHIQEMVARELTPELILQNSLTILNQPDITQQAIAEYRRTNSLSNVLNQLGIIDLDDKLLALVQKTEQQDKSVNYSFIALLEANQTIEATIKLLSTRLRLGLQYAIFLAAVVTVVVSIVNSTVLPQFQEIFASFDAELPALTKMALSWQQSLFSPGVIGVILIICFLYLLFATEKLFKTQFFSEQKLNSMLITRLPFIASVFSLIQSIFWLSRLKLVSSSDISLNSFLESYADFPAFLKLELPNIQQQLKTAESIGNLAVEIDYQSSQLNLLAEKTVTSASQKLITALVSLLFAFVLLTIVSLYLPIFQLGAFI